MSSRFSFSARSETTCRPSSDSARMSASSALAREVTALSTSGSPAAVVAAPAQLDVDRGAVDDRALLGLQPPLPPLDLGLLLLELLQLLLLGVDAQALVGPPARLLGDVAAAAAGRPSATRVSMRCSIRRAILSFQCVFSETVRPMGASSIRWFIGLTAGERTDRGRWRAVGRRGPSRSARTPLPGRPAAGHGRQGRWGYHALQVRERCGPPWPNAAGISHFLGAGGAGRTQKLVCLDPEYCPL